MLSSSECIPWMTVGLAESVAIVTFNLCTIIVFIRNRNLRKRSTYLVINLAVIDMFVGVIIVYFLFYRIGVLCNLWKGNLIEFGASEIFIQALGSSFLIASLTNITIIALGRVHATFCPLRHRVLRKWVYQLIIALVWVIYGLLAIPYFLAMFKETRYGISVFPTLVFSYLIFLLIISISYTSIVIKVRCGAQPRHHGAASRERKLTMTLLIVTVVSLLLCLPNVIWLVAVCFSKYVILLSLSLSVGFHLHAALAFVLYANSLVNPILYAIRMPEYRSAVLALFRRRPQQQRDVVVLPLREM